MAVTAPPRTSTYIGTLVLPNQIYVGDSATISLVLKRKARRSGLFPENIRKLAKNGEEISVTIQENAGHGDILGVSLLAAAIPKLDGNRDQQQLLIHNTLSFQWSCHFTESGKHTLSLVFKAIGSSGEREIAALHHPFKVVQVDSMTKRQVSLLGYLATLAGIGTSTIAIILKFDSILHLFGLR